MKMVGLTEKTWGFGDKKARDLAMGIFDSDL